MPVVLLASYSPLLGGAERAMLHFASALDADVWLACPPGPLADAAERGGIRTAPLRLRRLESRTGGMRDHVLAPLRQAGFQRELTLLGRALEPDLIVGCGLRAMLALGAGRSQPAPLVFLHNDLLPSGPIASVVRLAAARADLVIVPSRTVAADLNRQATVIHPGVAIEQFTGGDPPVSPPEIVVLGALIGWKRPDLALDIFARVRETIPAARLRFVGAPLGDAGAALLDALEARVARLGWSDGVDFTGEVADPADALQRATCLLHCADREPFGLAVAEALAAGRPAVVPAGAGPAEIVVDGCGVTYPAGDAAAAAAAVIALLQEPARAGAMGARGHERAQQRFSLTVAASAFAGAVGPLIRARAPAARRPATWSLVTVTHNSAEALESLLASVHRHAPQVRVIVVDNASADRTLDVAAAWSLRLSVESVALDENVGFGAACNVGVARVREPVTALINPDVELVDSSLAALAERAVPDRLLAPRVLRRDGRRQDSAHAHPGSPAAWLHAVTPGAVLPARAAAVLEPWRSEREVPVGWAVGCALVARTDTLRTLGPFDERLFLYGEDLDLGLRARAAGVATWFMPQAKVIHHGAHATSAAFGGEPHVILARARREAIARRLGSRAALGDDLAQAVTFVTRGLAKAMLGRSADRERQQLAALRSARRQR